MDDVKKFSSALLNNAPVMGGLSIKNRPAPFGLRAYKNEDGSYGGQMMPKSTGWLGPISDLNGNVMTEFSVSDEYGDFPSIVPTLNQQELTEIIYNKNVTPSAYQKAKFFADALRAKNKNPFFDND